MSARADLQFSTISPSSSITSGTQEPSGRGFEMFSFTFSPELLNLFWGLYKGSTENQISSSCVESKGGSFFLEKISPVQTVPAQPPRAYYLFGFQLPIHEDSLKRTVANVIKHSVITTGIVILVGFSSYWTYQGLLKLRSLFLVGYESETQINKVRWWWPTRLYNYYWKSPVPEKIPDKNKLLPVDSSCKMLPDKNHMLDLETIKLNLSLDLEKKNGKPGKTSSMLRGESNENLKWRQLVSDGQADNGYPQRPEGEHFSPSPVLSNLPSKGALKSLRKGGVQKRGRILVGDEDDVEYRDEDEEFQIEYFGPQESSSSSSTLSENSDPDEEYLSKIYGKNKRTGLDGGIPPGATLQTMISPIHSKAGPVRRKLDFGDVSPIPNASPSTSSATSSQFHHHHLPPLSASSSMSLSPSTPTTSSGTSPTATAS